MLILAGSYFLMRRHFHFFPRPQTLLAALAAALAMGGVLWLLRDAPVVAARATRRGPLRGLLYAISPSSRAAVLGVRP